MTEHIINDIEQAMQGSLSNEQMLLLHQVLEYTMRNVDVTEKTVENPEVTNTHLLNTFLAAKSVEGCSPKTIAYYRSTLCNALAKINRRVTHISTDDLREYLNAYQQNEHITKISIDNIRRILFFFFTGAVARVGNLLVHDKKKYYYQKFDYGNGEGVIFDCL